MTDLTEGATLSALLREVADDRFPAPDGQVTIMEPPSSRDAGVIGFTAHAVIFIDADRGWVRAQLPDGDLAGPLVAAARTAARHLVPASASLWAQVAPASAASVRALLAAGYRPVGAEAHLTHGDL